MLNMAVVGSIILPHSIAGKRASRHISIGLVVTCMVACAFFTLFFNLYAVRRNFPLFRQSPPNWGQHTEDDIPRGHHDVDSQQKRELQGSGPVEGGRSVEQGDPASHVHGRRSTTTEPQQQRQINSQYHHFRLAHARMSLTSLLLEYHPWLPDVSSLMAGAFPRLSSAELPAVAQQPLQKRFHIITTLYNSLARFGSYVAHLRQQQSVDWRKVHVYVLDDNSDAFDPAAAIALLRGTSASTSNNELQFSYFRNTRRMGPGYCKWFLFDAVRRTAGLSDVVLIVDGDDNLIGTQALARINRVYLTEKPLVTYGSCIGMFCEQQGNFETDVPWRSQWVYSHPRSFLAFMLGSLSPKDFQDNAGTWLMKGTDRGFMYKVLDTAGPDRVIFIPAPLYNYTESSISSYKVVPKAQKHRIIDEMISRPPVQQMTAALHVIMCIRDNPDNLRRVIQMLEKQDTGGVPVYLWVCNNIPSNREKLLQHSKASTGRVQTEIFDMQHSVGGFSRFLLATWLLQTTFYADMVIMLDDDIAFQSTDVLKLVSQSANPQSYNCWYGRRFQRNEDYWASTDINGDDIASQRKLAITSFHYCGTGLSVVDANVFESTALLHLPEDYMLVDDLWLSALATSYNYGMNRIIANAERLRPDTDLSTDIDIRARKSTFLSLLRAQFAYPH